MPSKQEILARKLIRIAHENPAKQAELLPKIHELLGRPAPGGGLSAKQAHDLAEAKALVDGTITAAAPPTEISRMPGFSPQQLRAHIDQLGKTRQELELLTAQFETQLKQIKALEKEEKKGMTALKKAASEMRDQGRFVAEAETALIQFTAYLTDKKPGIAQMIATEAEVKPGQKAGDFFGRIAAQLGDEVAATVQEIYEATEEDLTHVTQAVRGLKLIQKTSSFDSSTLKTAGVLDMVLDVKEWIAGKARKLFQFVGDIGRWVKGFMLRTKVVKDKKDDLKSALSDAMREIDAVM